MHALQALLYIGIECILQGSLWAPSCTLLQVESKQQFLNVSMWLPSRTCNLVHLSAALCGSTMTLHLPL